MQEYVCLFCVAADGTSLQSTSHSGLRELGHVPAHCNWEKSGRVPDQLCMITTSFKWTRGNNCVSIKSSAAARAQKLGILRWNAWLDTENLFVTHMACNDSVMEYCMRGWQMPRYWLWMETAAWLDRCLLPSVYSHLIFNNGAISGGRTGSKYTRKFMILTWMLQLHRGENPQSNNPTNCATAHETVENSHDDKQWQSISGLLFKNPCTHTQQQPPKSPFNGAHRWLRCEGFNYPKKGPPAGRLLFQAACFLLQWGGLKVLTRPQTMTEGSFLITLP